MICLVVNVYVLLRIPQLRGGGSSYVRYRSSAESGISFLQQKECAHQSRRMPFMAMLEK